MFLERLFLSLLMVFVTFNNFSDISYWHWAFETPFEGITEPMGVGKIMVGAILIALYLMLFRGVYRAKGAMGLFMTLVVIGTILWFIQTLGIIDLTNHDTGIIVSQVVIAIILSLGSMWSILWKRIFGQQAVEDPDTGSQEDWPENNNADSPAYSRAFRYFMKNRKKERIFIYILSFYILS